ncbi:MAG: nuclear transport factor 2 family protein [Solirubrobacterales bacterium]
MVDVSGRADSVSNESVIRGWFDAFNRRDLDGMLARFDPAVEFRPLRFPGVEQSYDGHDGIRAWFADVTGSGHVHRIDADDFSAMDDGRLLVGGSVSLAAVGGIAPFSGVYTLDRGLIIQASHYFTPGEVLERLGIIDRGG